MDSLTRLLSRFGRAAFPPLVLGLVALVACPFVLWRYEHRPPSRALLSPAPSRSRAASPSPALSSATVVPPTVVPPTVVPPTQPDRVAPPPQGYFPALVPPGQTASLPRDVQCAARIHRSTWEPRPQNVLENDTVPASVHFPSEWPATYDAHWLLWTLPRITGDFKGTTDEVLQWAACKWGVPDNLLRAVANTESTWFQGLKSATGQPVPERGWGDFTSNASLCPADYRQSLPCPQSFGLMSVKAHDFPGTFPAARDSTAFDVDFYAGWLRSCYEGWVVWLGQAGYPYRAGDIWGCVGAWYSGDWHSPAATHYIGVNEQAMAARAWLDPSWIRSQ
jgi:hypothetical protein